MTQEQLRMKMLAGIITEGQYKAKLNENIAVAKVRRAMEAAIDKIKNPADIERRINNVKFVVYNSLDPNTNGGERPPSDFQFDDAWWDSTHSQATDSVIASIYGELEAAVKGKSFGEDPMNETTTDNVSDWDNGMYIEIDREPNKKEQKDIALAAKKKFFVDPKKIKFETDPDTREHLVFIPFAGDYANMLDVLKKFGIEEPPYTSPHLR